MSEEGRPALGPMDVRKVMAALPHRYPMLLVDRVETLEPDVRIIASFNRKLSRGSPTVPFSIPECGI